MSFDLSFLLIFQYFQLLHRNFLDRYFSKVSYQFGNIVDDSYIFYNLGFHLFRFHLNQFISALQILKLSRIFKKVIFFRSEQFELFSKIFLDLSFVEAMLKATSSVDLLNEYKRYGNFIISNVIMDSFNNFFPMSDNKTTRGRFLVRLDTGKLLRTSYILITLDLRKCEFVCVCVHVCVCACVCVCMCVCVCAFENKAT